MLDISIPLDISFTRFAYNLVRIYNLFFSKSKVLFIFEIKNISPNKIVYDIMTTMLSHQGRFTCY